MPTSPEEIASLLNKIDGSVVSGLKQLALDFGVNLKLLGASLASLLADFILPDPANLKTNQEEDKDGKDKKKQTNEPPGPPSPGDILPKQLTDFGKQLKGLFDPLVDSLKTAGKVIGQMTHSPGMGKGTKAGDTFTDTVRSVVDGERTVHKYLSRLLRGERDAEPETESEFAPETSASETIQDTIPVAPSETPEGLELPSSQATVPVSAEEVPEGLALGSAGIGGEAATAPAAAAAPEVAGALASNPVGWIVAAVAAIVAVIAELALLPTQIKEFSQSLLEANRHFADVSASMAQVFAQSDQRDLLREKEEGDRLSGSARMLAQSHQDLSDNTKNIEILGGHIKNLAGTLVDQLVEPLAKLVDKIAAKIDEWIEANTEGSDSINADEWLRDVSSDARLARAQSDAHFGRAVAPRT